MPLLTGPARTIDYRANTGDPRQAYADWRQSGATGGLLVVDFELPRYWLPGSPGIALTALYLETANGLQLAVTDAGLRAEASAPEAQFRAWVEEHSPAVIRDAGPVALKPGYIPKPWGQEIWYTGVEERGVCEFSTAEGASPIPWVQAAWPDDRYGTAGEHLVLLKILDPSPEPVTGDLYFEMHREKREVYVVTAVDERAWPGGQGAIRYGFDPRRLAAFDSEEEFRSAYLDAVLAYEAARREIDGLPAGVSPDETLAARERALRQAMEEFTRLRPLAVGDVVKVPLCLPHSLQHGVRTIEFQTPVYERQILSFAQRVLTQDHWDTAAAVPDMLLQPPPEEPFEVIYEAPGARAEQIVSFPDFSVLRVRVEAGGEYPLDLPAHYALAMVVSGQLGVGELVLEAEQAVLLPRGWRGNLGPPEAAESLVFLLAWPRF